MSRYIGTRVLCDDTMAIILTFFTCASYNNMSTVSFFSLQLWWFMFNQSSFLHASVQNTVLVFIRLFKNYLWRNYLSKICGRNHCISAIALSYHRVIALSFHHHRFIYPSRDDAIMNFMTIFGPHKGDHWDSYNKNIPTLYYSLKIYLVSSLRFELWWWRIY